ncbi:MAG: membrane protein [Candidatus Syntrophoarchaeum caldarius]|uniref:Membrane protein n=1 Tax=Candidatus Syntropharchaeum caldarium TaxID=1838285 RepID=A0A1F2PAF5_9EURY|nr:MAG: membrane protein [Candidatus Syntrophoarchaeum caldarius]
MKIEKTTIVFVISIALLTVMAGTAMAMPATVNIADNPIINPLDGTTVTTHTVTVSDIDYGNLGNPQTRYISVITDDPNLQVKITGNDVDTGWTSTTRAGGTYTASGGSDYTFTLYVKGSASADGSHVTVSDNEGTSYDPDASADCASATRPVNIPEFATIALPLAATIGLFIYFDSRRKREEE